MRAGDFTTIVVLAGSFLRPMGGWLADRIGGYRLLLAILATLSASLFAVGTVPPIIVEVVFLFLTMGMLGMGNGAVFQLVPQRFPQRIGILTGLVGAAGGLISITVSSWSNQGPHGSILMGLVPDCWGVPSCCLGVAPRGDSVVYELGR